VITDLETYIERAKAMKGDEAGRAEDKATTALHPVVEFLRAGQAVAAVFCGQVDRDHALEAASVGVFGFGADEVVLTLDARMRAMTPEEGIEPGQLQREAEEGKPGIVDCLVVCRAGREGPQHMTILPYLVEPDGSVTWLDSGPRESKEERLVGVIGQALGSIFANADSIRPAAEALGLADDEAWVIRDRATSGRRAEMGCAVLVPVLDAERVADLERVARHMGARVENPPDDWPETS
jgi:hypothetical protein